MTVPYHWLDYHTLAERIYCIYIYIQGGRLLGSSTRLLPAIRIYHYESMTVSCDAVTRGRTGGQVLATLSGAGDDHDTL